MTNSDLAAGYAMPVHPGKLRLTQKAVFFAKPGKATLLYWFRLGDNSKYYVIRQ
jgi:hypothetical protein